MNQSESPKVVAFVPNVFDRSRFPDTVVFVGSADELDDHTPTTIVVDIDRCGDVAAFVLPDVATIGYGSHVNRQRKAESEAAGYANVVARSAFFSHMIDELA